MSSSSSAIAESYVADGSSGIGSEISTSSHTNENDRMWYFSSEQLTNSPSRRCGISADEEVSYRQLTAYLIQEMGQGLQISQLGINTAIVYMHRFYAIHSFSKFNRKSIAAASVFLSAKVVHQTRKLERIIKVAQCLPQTTDMNYTEQAEDIVFHENILLQTLGFDLAIDHTHTHVVQACFQLKVCKDLAQTAYFLASNSLHLTSMCLQYRPTVVACFCVYLACKWSRWEISQSIEKKDWFYHVDKSVSLDLLKKLTDEFIAIYEKSPPRFQSKLDLIKPKMDFIMSDFMKGYHSSINRDSSSTSVFSSNANAPQNPTSSVLLPQPLKMLSSSDMNSSQHLSSSVQFPSVPTVGSPLNQQQQTLSFEPSASNNSDKNSPKEDRSLTTSVSSSTPTKGDENCIFTSTSPSSSTSMTTSTTTNLSGLSGIRSDHTIPLAQGPIGMPLSELTGVGISASQQAGTGDLKRLSDSSNYTKHDDEFLQRENKIRKLDDSTSSHQELSSFQFSGSSTTETTHDKLPLPMVNGNETNSDSVRQQILSLNLN